MKKLSTTEKVLLWTVPILLGGGLIIYLLKRQKAKEAVNNSPLPEPNSKSSTAAVTTSSTTATASLFPLKKGSINSKVGDLQRLLGVTADNNFGSKTEAALKAFSGSATVASQAALDALSSKKASQQNTAASMSRAQQLYNQFTGGNLSIYCTADVTMLGYVTDNSGAIIYNDKYLNFGKNLQLNNSDYKLTGYTQGGNLQVTVTRGDNAGTYVVNPNTITLV